MDKYEDWPTRFPHLSRHRGAEILELVMNGNIEKLNNQLKTFSIPSGVRHIILLPICILALLMQTMKGMAVGRLIQSGIM